MSSLTESISETPGGQKRARWRRFGNRAEPYVFVGPAIILLLLLMLVPIVKVFRDSFYDNTFLSPSPALVGFENYTRILANPIFMQIIINTVVFTVCSVVLHLLIGLGLAMALNQPINRYWLSFFRVIFILPWIFTAAVVALAWQLILTPLGVFNYILELITQSPVTIDWLGNPDIALATLIFINAWRGYPFYMVSILAGLQSIPKEIHEAAYVDGANSWQVFLHVTLPQLTPILLSVALLDTIWTLNLFPLIWLTTGGGPNGATEMISTFTYKFAFNQFEFGLASAMAIIAVVATLCITFFYLRYQKSVD